MAGRTGYNAVDNSSPMLGPDQITDVYEHFDALVGESKPTAGDLPPTGNWPGRTIMAEDTGAVYRWVGSTWKTVYVPWTSYTPTTTNVSGGTVTGQWSRVGDTIHVRIVHAFIGANLTGQPSYGLPVNHVDGSIVEWLAGSCLLRDSSPATELLGVLRKSNVSSVAPYALAASLSFVQFDNVTPTSPFTWGSGDTIVMNFSYRCLA